MEKLKMHSSDLSQSNIEKIRALFPNCITESRAENGELKLAVDFDQLKQELSDSIVEGPQERYHLNWPGKREALLTANAPIAKTLRPCREESVNFDSTENLFIEGDNLEALKLLQETYLGKVKMIYIDPPYNTGKDFIYKDNFTESTTGFLTKSHQIDEEKNRLIANQESNGRFHSDWLSMIYSRVRLARNLLTEDGLIFISLDESEVSNMQRILDEIFGEDNLVTTFVWQNKKGGGNDAKYCAVEHEYLICFAKNKSTLPNLFEGYSEEYAKRYKEEDSEGRYFWDTFKRKSGKQYYSITCPDGTILDKDENGNPLSWLRSEARFKEDLSKGDIKIEKRGDNWSVMFKQRMPKGKKPRSLLLDKGTTSDGSALILELFGKNVFSNPKPLRLLEYLIELATSENDIILDFFAGSATTGHAVYNLNSNDDKKRKFILVQLDEDCPESSEAYKAGYRKINEVSRKRLNLASEKIYQDRPDTDEGIDFGFRYLKVATSNMTNVFYSPDQINQVDMFAQVENIKEDRTEEDLLFQVLLDWGCDLTLPISKQQIYSKDVFFVNADEDGEGADLIACFGKDISNDLIKKLAEKQPLRVVFRDDGFANDSVKINVEQIFKQISPMTDVKSI